MVTIKSLTRMLVLYINMKYTLAKNMSTFKAEDWVAQHRWLDYGCVLIPTAHGWAAHPALLLIAAWEERTPHKSTERTEMFSSSMLALMCFRFYKPQDKTWKNIKLIQGSCSSSKFQFQKLLHQMESNKGRLPF